MSDYRDSDIVTTDPAVAQAYRELEDNQVSPETRARVMQEAREALTPRRSRWFAGWRSMAVAASVLVAVIAAWQFSVLQGPENAPRVLGGGNTDPSSAALVQEVRHCHTDDDQAAWLVCIETLEQSGRDADADSEREHLQRRYPGQK